MNKVQVILDRGFMFKICGQIVGGVSFKGNGTMLVSSSYPVIQE